MNSFNKQSKSVVMNKFGDKLNSDEIPSQAPDPAPAPAPEPKPEPAPEPKPEPVPQRKRMY